MITTLTWLWLTNGMSHLETAASKGTFVLVFLLSPTRFWGRTATSSALFGQGCGSIDIASKEKHRDVSDVLYSGSFVAFGYLSLVEEDVLD